MEYHALNATLIQTLSEAGRIRSPEVRAAFEAVPRHLFVPTGTGLEEAYADKGIPVADDSGQVLSSVSSPTAVAAMLELLELRAGQKVLEIGAGSGYNAALMSHIVDESGKVVTVDLEAWLVEGARRNLSKLGIQNVICARGDGALGFSSEAPYDRIIVTAGAAQVPPTWAKQLAPNGILLVPFNIVGAATLLLRLRKVEGHLEGEVRGLMEFIGMRGQNPADGQPARVKVYLSNGGGTRVSLER